ncbi:MAG: AtpZ/AtpI family protein [Defluviitaleaceae bacterium]|nr:AtpZ/AtpI family protein [Defluviitaleaceae bacterium]
MENTTKPEEPKESFGKKTGLSNATGFTGEEKRTIARAMALMSQIAFSAIACVFAGVFLGRLLDNWLGTTPWLLIIFIFLGCVSAFKVIIDVAKKF